MVETRLQEAFVSFLLSLSRLIDRLNEHVGRAVAWLVAPVFLALVVVVALAPVQGWLRRIGVPRWLATTVLLILVALLLPFFGHGPRVDWLGLSLSVTNPEPTTGGAMAAAR